MKKIKSINSIGHVLCHDITQIIANEKKTTTFKKGHIIKEDDIPLLLSTGKEHLFVWENKEGWLHENEAAERLYNICKSNYMSPTKVKEGKIEIIAEINGLLKVDIELLYKINSIEQLMIATRHGNFPVKKGDKIAGTRVIPLLIEESKLIEAENVAAGKPILSIMPFVSKKVGIIVTGGEVASGRIKDTFGSVVEEKLKEYNAVVFERKILGDNPTQITNAILWFIEQNADMIICTGGMSVDADDTTPLAIKNTGAEIITYGAPVLPGAMLMISYYKKKIPIIGLPGCVMYGRRTIFDIILPWLMADNFITRQDLIHLGHGGFCLNCNTCNFPVCGFGK